MARKVKAEYASMADVPEADKDLYEEVGGKAVFAFQIEGMATQADLTRVTRALANEKAENKKHKETLDLLVGDSTAEEVRALLDSVPELKTKAEAGAKVDEAAIEKIVGARTQQLLTPLQRDLKAAQQALAEKEKLLGEFSAKERRRVIREAIRVACNGGDDGKGIKTLPSAVEDAMLLGETVFDITDNKIVTRDGLDGVTPFLSPSDWINEIAPKRPHWFETSGGGGGKGTRSFGESFGENPWSAEHWNVTKQMQECKLDRPRAEKMAKAAGSFIGATSPPKAKK